MAYQKSAEEWAAYFAQLPADEIVAVPFVWGKDDAEAALSIMCSDLEVTLTDDEWRWVTKSYEDNERFNDDSLETMRETLASVMVAWPTWKLGEIVDAQRSTMKEGK